jgi:hypothetical protein
MRWAGHVVRMGEKRGVYRVLVGKPEWKRPLGRPRRRWVDNIRMDLQEVGCGYLDWIGLAQDRDRWRTLVSAVMNLGVPWNAGNFLTSCKPVSFSRRTLHRGVSKQDQVLARSSTCVEVTPQNIHTLHHYFKALVVLSESNFKQQQEGTWTWHCDVTVISQGCLLLLWPFTVYRPDCRRIEWGK